MSNDYDYNNSRNFEGDTYDDRYTESAMPFVTFDNDLITESGEAELDALMGARVSPDGTVRTRRSAGGGISGVVADTPGV